MGKGPQEAVPQVKGRIMEFKDLTPETKAKLEGAKTPEDILALAKEEGYGLSDEELDGVSGGWGCSDRKWEPQPGCLERLP